MKISKVLAGMSAMAIASTMSVSAFAATEFSGVFNKDTEAWKNGFKQYTKEDGKTSDNYIDGKSLTKDTELTLKVDFKWNQLGKEQGFVVFGPGFANGWTRFASSSKGDKANGSDPASITSEYANANIAKTYAGTNYKVKADHLEDADGNMPAVQIKTDGFIMVSDTSVTSVTFTLSKDMVNKIIANATKDEDSWDGIIFQLGGGVDITKVTASQDGVLLGDGTEGKELEKLDESKHVHLTKKTITKKSTYFTKGTYECKCVNCSEIAEKGNIPLLTMAAPKAAKTTSNSVKLTWSKVSGAKGYEVYVNGKKVKTVTGTNYTVPKLKSGTTYKFTVKPYTKSGTKTVYGNASKVLTTATAPAAVNFKVTAGTGKATVKWSKVTGASGYKICYKTTAKGKWTTLKTVSSKTTSFTKTGLKKGKKYYFTVTAYKKSGGKTLTGTSAAKSVVIK